MLEWRVDTAEKEGSRRHERVHVHHLVVYLNNKNTDWIPWTCFGVVFKMQKQVWKVGLCSPPCQESQVTSPPPPPGPRTPTLLTQPCSTAPSLAPASQAAC